MANLIEAVSVSNPYGVQDIASHIKTEQRSDLVISDCMPYIGTYAFRFWIRSTLPQTISFRCDTYYKQFSINKEWKEFAVVFKVNKISNLHLELPKGQYWIYNTKLEIGSVHTDWSPHPEDDMGQYEERFSDLEKTLMEYKDITKVTQSIVDKVNQEILNSVSKTTFESTISGVEGSISEKFQNVEEGFNKWYVAVYDKTKFVDTKADDNIDDRERIDMAIFALENAEVAPEEELLVDDNSIAMRVDAKGKILYYMTWAKFARDTDIVINCNHNRGSIYFNGLLKFSSEEMKSDSIILQFKQGWNLIEMIGNEGNFSFNLNISENEYCELFNCLTANPTSMVAKTRSQGAYLNIYLDKIVSEVYDTETTMVDGVPRITKLKQSKIQQSTDAINFLVQRSDGEGGTQASEFNITAEGIAAITDKFVIKDVKGNAVVISEGQIHAQSFTTDMFATDAIKSLNYVAFERPVDSEPSAYLPQYSQQGTFVDLASGNIYTPSFFVDSINKKAFFKGTVYADSGVFNGTVYAEDGVFNGTVYANDGEFTGTIHATDGDFTGTIYATDGVFNGTVYATNGKFEGELKSNSAILGPWHLNEYAIYKGSETFSSSGWEDIYFGDEGLSLSDRLIYDAKNHSLRVNVDAFSIAGKSFFEQVLENGNRVYYTNEAPTNNNYPARVWNEENEQDMHIGDMCYDMSNGKTYIYQAVTASRFKIKFNAQSSTRPLDYVQIFYKYGRRIYRVMPKLLGDIGATEIVIPTADFYVYWHTTDGAALDHWGFKIDSVEPVVVETELTFAYAPVDLPSYAVDSSLAAGTYPQSEHPYVSTEYNKLWHVDTGLQDELQYQWGEVVNAELSESIAKSRRIYSYFHYDVTNGLVLYDGLATLPDRVLTLQDWLDAEQMLHGNIRLTSKGMDVYDKNKLLTSFGQQIIFYEPDTVDDVIAAIIDGNGLNMYHGTITLGDYFRVTDNEVFAGNPTGSKIWYKNGRLRLDVESLSVLGADASNAYSDYTNATYHAAAVPTTSNYPASDWLTREDCDQHVGATYYDENTGKMYQFTEKNPTELYRVTFNNDIELAPNDEIQLMYTINGTYYIITPTFDASSSKTFVIPKACFYLVFHQENVSENETYGGFSFTYTKINSGELTDATKILTDRFVGVMISFRDFIANRLTSITDYEPQNYDCWYYEAVIDGSNPTFIPSAYYEWIEIKNAELTQNTTNIAETRASLTDYISIFFEVERQSDRQMEIYNQNTDPKLEWDIDTYNVHRGDIWHTTITKDGVTTDAYYMWMGNKWEKMLTPPPVELVTTINGKSSVFVGPATPGDPQVGDLWFQGVDQPILTYIDANGVLKWDTYNYYTSDAHLNEFIQQTYNVEMSALETQADRKAETWYQADDPAEDWDTEELQRLHAGDIWYDTTDDIYKMYMATNDEENPYDWFPMIADPPEGVMNTISGKANIFVGSDTPTNAKIGDLWFKGKNDPILTYVIGDNGLGWYEYNKYTDDSQINSFIQNTYSPQYQTLKNQTDSKAETWYQSSDPAASWNTNELKQLHEGDIWYDTAGGVYKMYMVTNDEDKPYDWSEMIAEPPEDVINTITGKANIFVGNTTPLNPKTGDLWFKGVNEPIYTYTFGDDGYDWYVYNKYTDDSALNNFVQNTYSPQFSTLKSQTDSKAETWYQATDPAGINNSIWNTEELRQLHEGDIWYDTTDGVYKMYMATGDQAKPYAWEPMIADPPEGVMDTIDGKSSIFVGSTTPTNPQLNDLWFEGTDKPILTYVEVNGVKKWEVFNYYTDDSRIESFITDTYNVQIPALQTQADQKAETWYQANNPAGTNDSIWNTVEIRAKHVGDIWYNTTDDVYKIYAPVTNVAGKDHDWIEMKVAPPKTIMDTIDGKASIFVGTTTPSNPQLRDLWFKGENEPILTYVEVNGVNKWVEYNKYTDDTVAIESAKTATNYLYYDSTNGLVMHKMNRDKGENESFANFMASAGLNTRIDTNGFNIYNNNSLIARYGASGSYFYDGNGTTNNNIVAKYGSTGFEVLQGKIGLINFASTYNTQSKTYTYSTMYSGSHSAENSNANGFFLDSNGTFVLGNASTGSTSPYFKYYFDSTANTWKLSLRVDSLSIGGTNINPAYNTDTSGDISGASKIATNYLYYDATNGLVIHRPLANDVELTSSNFASQIGSIGSNMRLSASAMDFYYNNKLLSKYSDAGVAFYDGNGTAASNIVTQYSALGFRVYNGYIMDANSLKHVVLDGTGIYSGYRSSTSSSWTNHSAYNSSNYGFFLGIDGKFGVGNSNSYIRYTPSPGTNETALSIAVDTLSIGGTQFSNYISSAGSTATSYLKYVSTSATGYPTGLYLYSDTSKYNNDSTNTVPNILLNGNSNTVDIRKGALTLASLGSSSLTFYTSTAQKTLEASSTGVYIYKSGTLVASYTDDINLYASGQTSFPAAQIYVTQDEDNSTNTYKKSTLKLTASTTGTTSYYKSLELLVNYVGTAKLRFISKDSSNNPVSTVLWAYKTAAYKSNTFCNVFYKPVYLGGSDYESAVVDQGYVLVKSNSVSYITAMYSKTVNNTTTEYSTCLFADSYGAGLYSNMSSKPIIYQSLKSNEVYIGYQKGYSTGFDLYTLTMNINGSANITGGDIYLKSNSYGIYQMGADRTVDNITYSARKTCLMIFNNLCNLHIGADKLATTSNTGYYAKSIYLNCENLYKGTSGSSTTLSDERYKYDISTIQNAKSFIMGIEPKKFKFTDGTSKRYHTGFIAQQVRDVMYDTIGDSGVFCHIAIDEDDTNLDENNLLYSLRYEEIIAPHVAVTQEHEREIQSLKSEIAALKQQINVLLNKLG